jgi:uncharacterized membrane protein YkvA (DUF1232 family)
MRFDRKSASSRSWAGRKAWSGLERPARPNLAEDERVVRSGFWIKVRRTAARLPFAEDLLSAYYCAFDRETPLQVRAILLGALAYFVLPFDGIADVLPLIGFADDAAVLAAAMKLVIDNIRPEHREAARRKLQDI